MTRELMGELMMGEAKTGITDEVPPSFSSPLPGRRASGPTPRSAKGGWTNEEDAILARAVRQFDGKNWKRIAEAFPGRTDIQCLHRWQKVLNPELIKGSWTKDEDECIIKLVAKLGCKRWSTIAKSLPGRMGKQCRERWHNHLNPTIKKDAWTLEEEMVLIQCHQKYGNKWAEIAKFLPGRAENSIKNHWNCSLKKKLPSYLSSDIIGQSHIIAVNWKDCIRKVECSEVDPSKHSVAQLESRVVDSAAILDHQNPSTRAKALSSQPILGDESRCFGVNNQNTALENSRFRDMEVKVSPTRCNFMTEVNNSLEPSNYWIEKSPSASAQTPLSCNSHASSELSCHESDMRHRDDFAHENSSDDLQNYLPIRPKMHLYLSDHFSMDDHSYNDSSNNLGFDLSVSDGGCDSDLASGTRHLEIEKLELLPYPLLQTRDIVVPTSSEESAKQECYSKQNRCPVECSTPPNLSQSLASNPSPTSFLRSAVTSFKSTPSILRKRKHERSKQLFVDC